MKRWSYGIVLWSLAVSWSLGACGNDDKGGPGGPPECDDAAGGNPVKPYTGNVFREVPDLEVWGGVGEHRLAWERYSNTRFVPGGNFFGYGHQWRHRYQWEVNEAGRDGQNRLLLDVISPEGEVHRYTKINSSQWVPVVGIGDRMSENGVELTLQKSSGYRYVFRRVGGKYRLERFRDTQQNEYRLSYDGNGRMVRVSEPAGRYLQVSYQGIPVNRN
jgi:YD repeat-containing protein